jgi:hypothetical protein
LALSTLANLFIANLQAVVANLLAGVLCRPFFGPLPTFADCCQSERPLLMYATAFAGLCVTVGRVNTARLLDMCGNHG